MALFLCLIAEKVTMPDIQLSIFEDKDSLIQAADEQAQLAPEEYRESTRLYFYTRYFVAVYESRHDQIPIQVWNEYRNALDHFFRFITRNAQNTTSTHLQKMEGHLQRAALDILKLICHKSLDSYDAELQRYPIGVLQLVDNGKFIQEISAAKNKAEGLFTKAKTSDLNLGTEHEKNTEILSKYLDAAYAADNLRLQLIERENDIIQAKINHDSLTTKGKHLTIKEHTLFYLVFYSLMALAGALLKDPVVEAYHDVIDYFEDSYNKNSYEHKSKHNKELGIEGSKDKSEQLLTFK